MVRFDLRHLEKRLKLLSRKFAISKYASHEPHADYFACMNWNYGTAAIWMAHKVVVAFGSNYRESRTTQGRD